jgi:hypothetical protein
MTTRSTLHYLMDLIDSNDDNIEDDLNNLLEEDRVVEEVEDNNGCDTEDLAHLKKTCKT